MGSVQTSLNPDMKPHKPTPKERSADGSVRAEYERHGAAGYYQKHGPTYRNPHEAAVVECLRTATAKWPLDLNHVLDLAAGSGEATLALRDLGAKQIDGIDPYTAAVYESRTGARAEQITFADIERGAVEGRRYSLIVCSFALHLCEISRLPGVLYQLAQTANALLILTPHKRPEIRQQWGWTLMEELRVQRVRVRLYSSAQSSERNCFKPGVTI